MSDKTLDFGDVQDESGAADSPNFEKSLERLEEIVGQLESGDTDLEVSLALFEEGIALSRRCNRKLEAVERRLEVLVQNASGDDEVEPLQVDEDRVE